MLFWKITRLCISFIYSANHPRSPFLKKWLSRFCSFKFCDIFQEVYSVDQILKSKSVDWFLDHRGLTHETVNLLDSVLNMFKANMKKFYINIFYLCPLKITGNLCFLTFSGGIEMEHWCEMVWRQEKNINYLGVLLAVFLMALNE